MFFLSRFKCFLKILRLSDFFLRTLFNSAHLEILSNKKIHVIFVDGLGFSFEFETPLFHKILNPILGQPFIESILCSYKSILVYYLLSVVHQAFNQILTLIFKP